MADDGAAVPPPQQPAHQEPQPPPPVLQHHQRPHPRSINSQIRSYVCFINRTQKYVDVFWANYQGEESKYTTLSPGQQYKVNTYVTHPWLFKDAETHAELLVNSEQYFFPKPHPTLPEGQVLYGPACPRHAKALIRIPLYPLRDRAAQVVQSCLRDPSEASKLDIPKVLLNTLSKWSNS